MKRAEIVIILVIIVGGILLIPPLIGQGNYGAIAVSTLTGSGKFIVNTPYPTVPESLPVYRISDFEITPENATQIALSMGVRGNISNLYSDVIYIQDNSLDRPRRIEIYTNSGAVRYSIEDKIYVSGQSPPVLPSYDEAKKIADKYLEDRNLLSNDIRFREVIVGESRGETRAGDPRLISYPVVLDVIYERIINGTPIIGGSTIVYIGENGEVVGLVYRTRAIEEKPFRYVKIIRPEEAYRNLVDGKVLIRLYVRFALRHYEYLPPLLPERYRMVPKFCHASLCIFRG